MSRTVILFLALLLGGGVQLVYSQDIEFGTEGALVVFVEDTHDFGDITEGEVVSHVFNFKNSGTEPLILSDVKTTCGCTAPSWTKEPVMPGQEGSITVTFNSSGKAGRVNKTVTIISNATNSPAYVKIVTSVLPKEGE